MADDPAPHADVLDNAPAAPPTSAVSDMPVIDLSKAPLAEETAAPVDETAKPADREATPADKADGEPTGGDKEPGDADKTTPQERAAWTRLRNNARAAEQRASELQAQNANLAETIKNLTGEKVETKTDPRPSRDAFTDPDAYDTALIEWSGRQATEKATLEAMAKFVQDTQRQAAEATLSTYQERRAAFEEDHPDFQEVVMNDDLKISDPMTRAIVAAEDGPAIAYYLGQNPEVAERLSKLQPVQAVYEIGKISTKLAAPATPPRAKPAPITPIGARSGNGLIDPADESMDSYGARRIKELRESRMN